MAAAKRKFKKSKLATVVKKTKTSEQDVLELNFWNSKLKSTVAGIKKVLQHGKKGE